MLLPTDRRDPLTNAPELQGRVSSSLKKPKMTTCGGFCWAGIVSIFHLISGFAHKDLTVANSGLRDQGIFIFLLHVGFFC